jgi:hypothetical protein
MGLGPRHDRAWKGPAKVRIWYDDGSSPIIETVDQWNKQPKYGVLFVKGPTASRDHKLHRDQDYYWIEQGIVFSCAIKDLNNYLERDQGISNVKFGRITTTPKYEKAKKEALDWVG